MLYYESLGLEPKLSVDLDDLKSRFYARSREWHPDRFSRASAEEQQKALDMTAMLNDAFRTLRDPYARAEYYFKQSGIELPKEASKGILSEFFELNMAIEELKSGDESVRPQLVDAQQRKLKLQEEGSRRLGEFFEFFDEFDESQRQMLLEPIGDLLNLRRYVSNFLRGVEKVLNVHVPD